VNAEEVKEQDILAIRERLEVQASWVRNLGITGRN